MDIEYSDARSGMYDLYNPGREPFVLARMRVTTRSRQADVRNRPYRHPQSLRILREIVEVKRNLAQEGTEQPAKIPRE